MRGRRWYYPLTVLVLALLIWRGCGALGDLAQTGVQRSRLPEGWMLIRPPHETSALVLDGDVVLAGGRDGLFAIDRAAGVLQGSPPGAPAMRYIRDLQLDSRGRLWVAHSRGVAFRDGGRWEDCPEVSRLIRGPATALCEDSEGHIWVGGAAEGIAVLRDGAWGLLQGDVPALADVNVIFASSDGSVWIGMGGPRGGGLARYVRANWRVYTTEDGLPHNAVRDVIEARSGDIWVATGFSSRGGVARLHDRRWTTFNTEDRLPEGSIRSLFEDRDGRIWIGSEYDGMVVVSESQTVSLTPQEGLAGWETKDIAQDSSGMLWLGTEDGITRMEEPP